MSDDIRPLQIFLSKMSGRIVSRGEVLEFLKEYEEWELNRGKENESSKEPVCGQR